MNKHTEIWIDTISFSEKGGWKEDTQFVHLMGSGYLMAADDVGVPVKDSVTSVRIPEAGKYRIWARTRNWMRQYSPGKFTLIVNGVSSGAVLGAMPSDRWVWEIAGDFDLPRGDSTLALHDLTGWFGRCAALLITNDFDYVPPREIGRMQDERARILGLPAGISEGETYDVIVAGGGPGGVPAAVAAARLGEKVLLIHDRPILGGNAGGEIGIPSFGAEVSHIHAREGGIAEELMRLRDREKEPLGEWTRAMEKLVHAEPNI
ncbi:MAG: FAD-dependent oxidoreductase, partial [Lachnospiraceae bacterium]|nr:FAD-dependent oxidoreductase [Lachnospiraceae bacterium]